jgi:hypothetical protein
VWLDASGALPKKIGAVGEQLIRDAARHGQDVVDKLVDQALKEVERRT